MDKERFLASGLIEQYVLGLTSPEESAEVERYANAFPEIKKEILNLQEALEQYAIEQAIPPPPSLKNKLMAEVNGANQEHPPVKNNIPEIRKGSLAVWLSFLAIIGLLGFTLLFYKKQARLQKNLEETTLAFQKYRDQCENQQENLRQKAQLYAFVTNPETKTVPLKGTKLSPESNAIVYYNEHQEKVYLTINSLPPSAQRKTIPNMGRCRRRND